MPTFVFTDPQGRTHKVTGPPGATEEQAFQILQQQRPPEAPPPETIDPTEGMGWGEKALANVGSGIDTAWQGAKQLVGQGEGDEALQEKRRIDKQLAERTTGGGLLQVAGEVLPTIPLGLGAGLGARAAGGLAARMAASPTLAGMGGGAAAGAMIPVTEGESRLQNIGLGAAGGGAAPHVLKLAMAGGRGVRNVGERAAAALPGSLGLAAAERVGGRKTADLLERELPEGVPRNVYTPDPGIYPSGVGPSAAVRTQDPRLASLERGSRTSGGEHWMDYDRAAHQQRWEAIDQQLRTTGDLDGALAQANQVGSEVPYAAVNPQAFNAEMDGFMQALQQAKQSAAYHGNPTVQAAVDYVEGTMQRAGQVTPELLHTMRRTISKGLTGAPGAGEAGVRAASSEPFIIGLSRSMDDVLDRSSGGAWGAWKSAYADAMKTAESIKADTNIRGRFIDPASGMPRKPTAGADDVPVVTPAALKQAIAAAGTMKRGPRKGQNVLGPQSEAALQGVRKDLDAQAILQRAKAASTGGSGSDTASNMAQAALMEVFLPSGLGVGRLVAGESNRKAQQAMQKQLAELLQDPEKLRAFMLQQSQLRALRGQTPDLPGLGVGAGAVMLGGAGQ